MSQSFPVRERLKKEAAFKAVLREGRKVSRENLILWISSNALSYNRIGLSCPRRYFKLSSQRNRLRRLLREVYRKNKEKFKEGHDILIMIRNAGPLPEYKELEDSLLCLFTKAELVK